MKLAYTLLLVLASVASAAEKPNFIFILSDDIAQGDMGVYGQELIQTPTLDRLANEGTLFNQAYTGTSVCAPCRSVFYTGLHSGNSPVRGNFEWVPEGQYPIDAEIVTVGEIARNAGYHTATFGKWGMGFFDTEGAPQKQGMDYFFGYNCQRHAHSYFPTYLYSNDQPIALPGNNGRDVGETYAQELIQRDMIRWLKKNGKDPFFLFYAITLPHGRFEIDDYGIYADRPWSDKQKAYAAMVTRIDSDVKELVDTLKALGVEKNTLIVFGGDNGSSFDPKSDIGKLFNQTMDGKLRGYKRGMYEGALRQASFAWWPGTVPAGRVTDEPWAYWDLMPTFVEMTGVEPPEGYETDGFSLLFFLKGGEAPERDYFYWELHEGRPAGAVRAARWDDWKTVMPKPMGEIEIYDLAKDAAETNNLADQRPDLVKKAKAIFADAHTPHPVWPLDRTSHLKKEASSKAWPIKRKRDREGYVPEGAIPLAEYLNH
ncbi:N-acetylgalactosamine 6-sulfate sulfatase [Coraliomargarita sinensis]|uniref:N-acetylgalactosamine 6-sulfate sulfatase n=1 Tax=Coraliomargarita sinensis TaxID=2174842 RepID=A0A317ZL02_9BACT|nr:arylsulfatase [Coraliomargarita sinensis]PXA04893.1 N-acetylgalactosamine 6-sulfate sulfatase [Coraliomargarita sinensis]